MYSDRCVFIQRSISESINNTRLLASGSETIPQWSQRVSPQGTRDACEDTRCHPKRRFYRCCMIIWNDLTLKRTRSSLPTNRQRPCLLNWSPHWNCLRGKIARTPRAHECRDVRTREWGGRARHPRYLHYSWWCVASQWSRLDRERRSERNGKKRRSGDGQIHPIADVA